MASSLIDSRYSLVRLALSIIAGTIVSVGMWGMVLVLPDVQSDFGVSRADASIAFTGTMIGFAFGNLLLGRAVDRYGIAYVLVASGFLLSFAFVLGSFTQSITQFAIVQVLIGFATASGFAPIIADVSHWFRKRRGIAVAAAACGNYVAGAIWPLLLKSTLADEGWRPAFIIVAVVSIITILPVAWFLRHRSPSSSTLQIPVEGVALRPSHTIPVPFSARTLQIMLAVAGISCCVAMAMPQVHIVAYCADLGYGVTVGAQMLSTMLGAGIISRLIFGYIADLIGGVRTLLISSTFQCIALFLYIPFDGLMSLYVVSLIFGLSQGGIVPSYALIVREYLPAEEAGRRVGMVIMATVIGMAFGGWLSGVIYDLTGSYQTAFLNGIAWNFINIAIMSILLLKTRNNYAAA